MLLALLGLFLISVSMLTNGVSGLDKLEHPRSEIKCYAGPNDNTSTYDLPLKEVIGLVDLQQEFPENIIISCRLAYCFDDDYNTTMSLNVSAIRWCFQNDSPNITEGRHPLCVDLITHDEGTYVHFYNDQGFSIFAGANASHAVGTNGAVGTNPIQNSTLVNETCSYFWIHDFQFVSPPALALPLPASTANLLSAGTSEGTVLNIDAGFEVDAQYDTGVDKPLNVSDCETKCNATIIPAGDCKILCAIYSCETADDTPECKAAHTICGALCNFVVKEACQFCKLPIEHTTLMVARILATPPAAQPQSTTFPIFFWFIIGIFCLLVFLVLLLLVWYFCIRTAPGYVSTTTDNDNMEMIPSDDMDV